MWRSGWKVVRPGGYGKPAEVERFPSIPWPDRRYTSVFGAQGIGRVDYYHEKRTRPHRHHGPLSVFKSLRTAMEFLRSPGVTDKYPAVVVPCLYRQSDMFQFWVPSPYCSMYGDDKHFWINRNPVPEGTDFADVVVLLRPVDAREVLRL